MDDPFIQIVFCISGVVCIVAILINWAVNGPPDDWH